MNLATNVAGLINSKPREQDNDKCKQTWGDKTTPHHEGNKSYIVIQLSNNRMIKKAITL